MVLVYLEQTITQLSNQPKWKVKFVTLGVEVAGGVGDWQAVDVGAAGV